MPERRIVEIHAFCFTELRIGSYFSFLDDSRFGWRGGLSKFQMAFTDQDVIAIIKRVFELHAAIDKNMIDAPDKLAVLDIAVNYLESLIVAGNKRVLA